MIGPGDESWLEAVAPLLEDVFEADSSVMAAIALPEDAYNASRRQYYSTGIA